MEKEQHFKMLENQIYKKNLITARKIGALKTQSPPLANIQNRLVFDHLALYENSHHFLKKQSKLNNYVSCSNIKSSKNNASKSITSSRIRYKRGHEPQRIYFRTLLEQLDEFQNSITQLKHMNSSQLCEYRNQYIQKYLSNFFHEIDIQCYEKSVLIKRVFKSIQNVFSEIFERLYKSVLKEEKNYLDGTLQLHKNYQQRIKELINTLSEKQQQIRSIQGYYQAMCNKNKMKNKKNKNLSQGLIRAGQRIIEIQDQVDNFEKQYIKMLTLGYQGGLTYEQAKQQVFKQFFYNTFQQKLSKQLKKSAYYLKKKFAQNSANSQSAPSVKYQICNNQPKVQNKNIKIQTNILNYQTLNQEIDFGYIYKYRKGFLINEGTQTIGSLYKKQQFREYGVQHQIQQSIIHNRRQIILSDNIQESLVINQCSELTAPNQRIIDKQEMKFQIQEQKIREQNTDNKNQNKQESQKQIKIVPMKKGSKQSIRKKPSKFKANTSNFKRDNLHRTDSNSEMVNNLGSRKKNTGKISMRLNKKMLQENIRYSQDILDKDESIHSSDNQSSFSSNQTEKSQQYKQTDLLSVIQNMQNISPQGIYIDETLLFLLKKSIFSVKHSKDNGFSNKMQKKNSKILHLIRSSSNDNRQRKPNPISIKSIIKLISITYQNIFLKLAKHGNKNLKNSVQINLLSELKKAVIKQYPMCQNSTDEINKKLLALTKSMQVYGISNYLIKNFMMLSTLDQGIYSPILYQDDIIFYFNLLKKLSINNIISMVQKNLVNNAKKFLFINNSGVQQVYTTVGRLKQVLRDFVEVIYTKKQLCESITKKIMEIFERNNQIQIRQQTRLDIFKCSQLIIQTILNFKIESFKSYTKLVSIPDITHKGLITQSLLIDLLEFLHLSKLKVLNIINKFRYLYGKKATLSGISLLCFIDFCMMTNIPDFDTILLFIRKNSALPNGIQSKDLPLNNNFQKIDKISHYVYHQEKEVGRKIFVGAQRFVHTKITEIETSNLLQNMIGENMTKLYITSLCQLEQKKHSIFQEEYKQNQK